MAYQDDTYYIERFRSNGDRYAFSALVNKHQTMVFNIGLRVTRNREDAEEIAQDAFIKLFHALPEFRGESRFTTWLYRITLNLALNKIRKKSLFDTSTDESYFHEPEPEFEMPLEQKERHRILREAIQRLEETDALLITLFYMDDQSIEEIAAITGLTPSNVKVKLFRARKKLSERISRTLDYSVTASI